MGPAGPFSRLSRKGEGVSSPVCSPCLIFRCNCRGLAVRGGWGGAAQRITVAWLSLSFK